PPQRLELEAVRWTRTTCAGRSPGSQAASKDAGPLAFPRLGAVALRADVTCLPLRGQRRNCPTMTWGAPASRFTPPLERTSRRCKNAFAGTFKRWGTCDAAQSRDGRRVAQVRGGQSLSVRVDTSISSPSSPT